MPRYDAAPDGAAVSKSTERCAICLEPFRLGDVVERTYGSPTHLGCLERIRKPGAKVERQAPAGLKNAHRQRGSDLPGL